MKLAIYLACSVAFFFIVPNHAKAQPNITDSIYVLQKICHGNEQGYINIQSTLYNSIFAIGATQNPDGLGSGGTQLDMKLCKMNSSFDTLWSVVYGGLNTDYLNKLEELPNGNLVLAGYCESKDGTLQGVAHSNYGREAWVIVIDTLGNILHQKCFGGSGGAQLYALHVDERSNIYIGGNTNVADYDFAHSFGSPNDAWMIKLDSSLNHQWTKIWGGNDDDGIGFIGKGLTNNTIMASFYTWSTDALLGSNGSIGLADGMIMQLDTSGNEIWSKRYGGSQPDGFGKIMPDSIHRCYYLAGTSGSIDGDIQYKTDSTFYLGEYKGNDWIARIDSVGNLLCSKAYGCKLVDTNQFWGQHQPVYVDAMWHNDAVWYTSHVEGGNGDFPPNSEFSREDFWIAKIDSQCNLRGKYIVNTNFKNDISVNFFKVGNSLKLNGASAFLFSNNDPNTFSCDTSKNLRFVLELGDAPLSNGSQEKPHLINWQVYPNPAQEKCMIQLENEINQSFTLIVTNSQGQVVWSKKIKNKSNYLLNTQAFTKGLYFITLKTSTTQSTRQILIQ